MEKNILEICLSPNLGGLELYMQRLSRYLYSQADSNINLHIGLAEKGRLSNNVSDIASENTLLLKKSKFSNLFSNAKKLARYIDENKIDCLHMHWTKDLPVCVFAIKLSRQKPKLVQTRHMHMTRFKSDFYHRFLYANIDLMIAVTKEVKSQIQRFVPDEICPKVTVSYIGSDRFDAQKGSQPLLDKYNLTNQFIIGLAGRIEPAKGQALLIEALRLINDKNIHVLFIGDAMENEYLHELKQKIEHYHLDQQVTFTGFINNVQEVMSLCDCTVLATTNETFGMVLVEAMHTGTAVIASNAGGPLEIIEHHENGLLFEANNAADLAGKIQLYISNPDFKQQLANAGQKTALKRFESTSQFAEVKNILLKALN